MFKLKLTFTDIKEFIYYNIFRFEKHCEKCKLGYSEYGVEDYSGCCELHLHYEDFEPELMCFMPTCIKRKMGKNRMEKYWDGYVNFVIDDEEFENI